MVSWLDVEQGAPHIAQAGRTRLDQARVALLGTLRPDGSPRISPVEPYFTHGQLIFGVMTWSGKAHDLRRDPRCVLHTTISGPDAGEAELKLYGQAATASGRLREACRQAWWLRQPRPAADVYLLDMTEAVLIEWDLQRRTDDRHPLVARTWGLAAGPRLSLTAARTPTPATSDQSPRWEAFRQF